MKFFTTKIDGLENLPKLVSLCEKLCVKKLSIYEVLSAFCILSGVEVHIHSWDIFLNGETCVPISMHKIIHSFALCCGLGGVATET